MKAERPYKMVNGERVTLTHSEMKSYIMKVNNWSEAEYNRQRYLMKNKLRTYEAFQHVEADKVQSPVNIMYFQSRSIAGARKRGETYEPSNEMKRLQAFAGLGSKRQIEKALANEKLMKKWGAEYKATTEKQFAGLIATMEKAKAEYDAIEDPEARKASKLKKMADAKAIIDNIADPVKREKALAAYADELKLSEKQKREATAAQAIPITSGEVAGYGDFDFDFSDYLD